MMVVVVALVWCGMIVGVSFLATPVKFQAASLTMPVALDVGRATFHLFGRVEALLAVVLGVGVAVMLGELSLGVVCLVATVVAIVATQLVWLIPRLDARVEIIIGGGEPPRSRLHAVYAGIEAAKAVLLLIVGLTA